MSEIHIGAEGFQNFSTCAEERTRALRWSKRWMDAVVAKLFAAYRARQSMLVERVLRKGLATMD